jgi:Rrf2 family protein
VGPNSAPPPVRFEHLSPEAKTEYACVAILELASSYGTGEPVRSREIARKHGVPQRFLIQILLQLKAAGLVASTRGAAGGYHLTCSPEDVSLGQVMDLMKGQALTSPSASPDSPAVKVLMKAWEDVDAKVRQILNEITFAELVDRAKEEDSLTYHI